jgi:hypothetical protein
VAISHGKASDALLDFPGFQQAPWPEYGGAAGPLQPNCALHHTVEPIMVHDNGVRELTEERQRHKEDCSALALREASKSAAGALVAAAGTRLRSQLVLSWLPTRTGHLRQGSARGATSVQLPRSLTSSPSNLGVRYLCWYECMSGCQRAKAFEPQLPIHRTMSREAVA